MLWRPLGNGTLLLSLLYPGKGKQPYDPAKLCGIDYSEASVELAKGVERARREHGSPSDGDSSDGEEEEVPMQAIGEGPVDWRVADLLRHDFAGETWDLVMDKGTYDALALSADPMEDGRLPSVVYPERVARMVKNGGFFLITCEWAIASPGCAQSQTILQLATLPKTRSRSGMADPSWA